MGMACSCTCEIFLKNVQTPWTPLLFRTAFHGSLSTRLLNRSESAKVAVLLTLLLTSPRIKNSIILWLLYPRWPLTITSPTSPSLFTKVRSIRAPSLVGSHTSCEQIKATSPIIDLCTHDWTVLQCSWVIQERSYGSFFNWKSLKKKEKNAVCVMGKSGNSLNQLAQQRVHCDLWNTCGL